MYTYPMAEIDVSALIHNLQIVRQFTSAKILAIVKADAYGHGLIPIAQALTPGVDGLGVARLEEALKLRRNGITKKILLLEGVIDMKELELVIKYDIDIVVHSEFQIVLLETLSVKSLLSVWLGVDVGLRHLGFLPEQVTEMHQRLEKCTAIKKPLSFMTHFSRAGERDKSATRAQAELFNSVVGGFVGERSLAKSAAFLACPETAGDWVRPGILLYGYSPFNLEKLILRPVMTLKSKVIAIKKLRTGDSIGYGATWSCPDDMRVAIVKIGYADGYPRNALSGTPLLIRSKLLPLIGSVSMDKITVDLRGADDVEIGDEVVLWGKGLSLDIIAEYLNISNSELLTRLTQRITYSYI